MPTIVFHGDSITRSSACDQFGGDVNDTYPKVFEAISTARGQAAFTLVQSGQNGASWDYFLPSEDEDITLIDDAAGEVDPHVGADDLLVLFAGTNGVTLGSHTGAEEYEDFEEYLADRISAGWVASNIYVLSMLRRVGLTGENDEYNDLLEAGAVTHGYNFIDFRTDEEIELAAPFSEIYYSTDNIHPTILTHSLIAERVYDAIWEPTWTAASLETAGRISILAWYDLQNGGSVTQSTGFIDQLNDLSGNGYHLTSTSTNRPAYASTLNGHPAAVFASNDYLENASIAGAFEATSLGIFVAGSTTQGNAGAFVHLGNALTTHTDGAFVRVNDLGIEDGITSGFNIYGLPSTFSGLSGDFLAIGTSHSEDADGDSPGWLYINGVRGAGSGTAGGHVDEDCNGIRLGKSWHTSNVWSLVGKIGEVIITDGLAHHVDIERIAAYINTKWAEEVGDCVSIDVDDLDIDTYAADSFAGFTSPETEVVSDAGGKLLQATSGQPLIVTTTLAQRDSSITTHTHRGIMFLRLSGVPGSQKALFAKINNAASGGEISVGIVEDFDETDDPIWDGPGSYYARYVNSDVEASAEGIAAGYSTTYTPGDEFEFGVEGFEVYLKFNDADLCRYTEIRHMEEGRSAVAQHSGFRNIDVCPLDVELYSDLFNSEYDPRDFGAFPDVSTTGSITVGTDQLVVADDIFEVGDTIIVEVGTESGLGMRNTVGVGGTWPASSFPDEATLTASDPGDGESYAYQEDNGEVWGWFDDDHWANISTDYYAGHKYPIALVAEITAIDGLTLTLDTDASATATNAGVYLDSRPSLTELLLTNRTSAEGFDGATYPDGMVIPFQAGTYVFSRVIEGSGRKNLTVQGEGRTRTTFLCPPGVRQLLWSHFNGAAADYSPVTFQDFKIVGNHADDGYGFHLDGDDPNGRTETAQGGLAISQCGDCIIRRVDALNLSGQCFGISAHTSPTDPLIEDCTATIESEQHKYNQWAIAIVGAVGGGIIRRCTASAPYLYKAFEIFVCSGYEGEGALIQLCGGQNVFFATNSSNTWTLDRCWSIIQENSWSSIATGHIADGVFNINVNAFPANAGGGGTMLAPSVIQLGPADGVDCLRAIQVQPACVDITIEGRYPQCPVSDTYGGLVQGPDWEMGMNQYGGACIISDAPRTIVRGMRAIGAGRPLDQISGGYYGNIALTGDDSEVEACVADLIATGPTLADNMTNAEYATYCATPPEPDRGFR
jgi:lysophospholipase L1-like esterase